MLQALRSSSLAGLKLEQHAAAARCQRRAATVVAAAAEEGEVQLDPLERCELQARLVVASTEYKFGAQFSLAGQLGVQQPVAVAALLPRLRSGWRAARACQAIKRGKLPKLTLLLPPAHLQCG